ncbi:MAG TPA: MoxR family ATPase [Niastella sp.]
MNELKPYPNSTNDNAREYSGRFIQNINGVMGAHAVNPKIPQGKFEFTNENGLISATFVPATDGAGNSITRPGRTIPPYIPSRDVKEIVRLAQILKRPVLIKGEPGSGKTQLSRAVAYEWYGDNYQQHYFEWIVKSTTSAADGLYSFDHVARLRDAQLAQIDAGLRNKKNTDYRQFGPMAMAFLTSTPEQPSILLIDEIDKADIDFPNDLLLELDERRFKIPDTETGEIIEAGYPPLIFITSNDERELPEAFLRRCIFLYMKFPNDDQMREIIKAHLPALVKDQEEFTKTILAGINNGHAMQPKDFIDLANRQFRNLKIKREKDLVDNKRVSTSELIDWLTAFHYDWKNKTENFYQQTSDYISAYIKEQAIDGKTEAEVNEALKKFEDESIGNYNFYSQTVLKSYAAIAAKEPFKGVMQEQPN